jgi:hypothetical protein
MGKIVDKFQNHIEWFSKKQFPKKKVIVEGVQLLDDTMYPDKQFFKGKPIIIPKTGMVRSFIRRSIRDKSGLQSIHKIKDIIRTFKISNRELKNISRIANDR